MSNKSALIIMGILFALEWLSDFGNMKLTKLNVLGILCAGATFVICFIHLWRQQLAKLYGHEQVGNAVHSKLERLQGRLKESTDE